jgi:uncharacterized protein YeeX (DUF496 family)
MSFVPPTEDEQKAVERLREKLSQDKTDSKFVFTNTAILRFYRGRKQDEEKAYRALVKHLEWRAEHHVDSIHENLLSFETELKSGKIIVEGSDHHGRPAIFVFARKHNKNQRDIEQVRMLIIYTLETILKKAKEEEERIVLCFDLSGFSYSCMDYDAVKLLVNILQYNYPDTLHVALVINAPFLFSACWAIIRPWLDPVTAAKALFVSKQQLLEYFPAEMLPKDL